MLTYAFNKVKGWCYEIASNLFPKKKKKTLNHVEEKPKVPLFSRQKEGSLFFTPSVP
jgi:hypothetical protein